MKTKFAVFIVIIVLIVVGLGVFMNNNQKPSKFDDFAKALTSQGSEFFGAFWCSHCQAQKALFGSSKKYLPYVECSNPDQSQTQICKDNKIESYPTWKFKDGVKITSVNEPTICQISGSVTDPTQEPPICATSASSYTKTWIFPGYKFSIKSPAEPTKDGDEWIFEAGSMAVGEIPMEFLAKQIGFVLPE